MALQLERSTGRRVTIQGLPVNNDPLLLYKDSDAAILLPPNACSLYLLPPLAGMAVQRPERSTQLLLPLSPTLQLSAHWDSFSRRSQGGEGGEGAVLPRECSGRDTDRGLRIVLGVGFGGLRITGTDLELSSVLTKRTNTHTQACVHSPLHSFSRKAVRLSRSSF